MNSNFNNTTPSSIPFKLCIIISIIIAIALFLLYKWLQNRNDDTSPFKKKFRNFLGNNTDNTNDNNNTNEKNNVFLNHNNSYNTFDNNGSFSNYDNNNNESNMIPTQKISRFVMDYCRTSPNITHIQKDIVNIGWRSNFKYHYCINMEYFNHLSEKTISNSIMTVIPLINFTMFDLGESNNRVACSKLLIDLSSNHPSLIQYTHFAILNLPKFLIKITPLYSTGSLHDYINKNDPLIPYTIKSNRKSTPLSLNQILSFSQQILKGLAYLHRNNWYHLHLHTGNILLDEKENKCYINDIENSLLDIPIKNEKYIHYIYEFLNNEFVFNQGNGQNNSILSEILISINLFEKIDIVLFGRMLYEMVFGKELLSNSPDDLELKELHPKLKQVLSLIFPKKYINGNLSLSLPERSALELLNIFTGKSNIERSDDIDNEYNSLISQDKYNWIKERVFRQNAFIKSKLKGMNDVKIETNKII